MNVCVLDDSHSLYYWITLKLVPHTLYECFGVGLADPLIQQLSAV